MFMQYQCKEQESSLIHTFYSYAFNDMFSLSVITMYYVLVFISPVYSLRVGVV